MNISSRKRERERDKERQREFIENKNKCIHGVHTQIQRSRKEKTSEIAKTYRDVSCRRNAGETSGREGASVCKRISGCPGGWGVGRVGGGTAAAAAAAAGQGRRVEETRRRLQNPNES